MEALIAAGVPQRTAHELVGTFVRRAMTQGVSLAELTDQEFLQDYTGWNASLRSALGASRAVERMVSFGSTAPGSVAEQIAGWRQRLGAAATP
jgi:argininosuccinate lyase